MPATGLSAHRSDHSTARPARQCRDDNADAAQSADAAIARCRTSRGGHRPCPSLPTRYQRPHPATGPDSRDRRRSPPAASSVIWARTVGLIAVVTVIVLAIGEVLGHG